jgi:cytochrome d ubiquinol oxidase subunit I
MIEAPDAVLLARFQFAFTIAFHILFPAFTIGLASYLVTLEGLWLATRREVFRRLYDFWLKLFALSFGMGVVSGVVMSYQFGTNWSEFSAATGNVLGPLLGYEVLTAFFLEASFLGVMLFGRDRVSDRVHFLATVVVAVGTLISAFWILSANSWMHTPSGHELRDGVFYPADWLAIVFNPSTPYRVVHMVFAAYLATAMVVAAVGAYHLGRGRDDPAARVMLRMALPFIALFAVAQVIAGHEHGVNVHQHQPVKLAAMEGHWQSYDRAAPLILFAWPDAEREDNAWELAVPAIGSLVVTGSFDGAIEGLQAWPRTERPPVAIVFWSFRLMVGMGLVMLAVGAWGCLLLWRGGLQGRRAFRRLCLLAAPSGFVAILAGWVTAEVGRQPYVVYGLMRTVDAVSPVTAEAVGLSLLVYVTVYCAVFGTGIYFLAQLARRGPAPRAAGAAVGDATASPLVSWLRRFGNGRAG